MAAMRNRELTRTRSSALSWRGAGAERMGAGRRGPWRMSAGRMRAARRSSTLAAVLAVVAAVCLLWLPARADAILYDRLDPEQNGTLTVSLVDDGMGVEGAELSLYRVADISSDAHFTLADDFAAYPVNLTGLDASEWRAAAQTLSAYAARDGIVPAATVSTNVEGAASFGTVSAGLYLVVASPVEVGNVVYTAETTLISVPGLNDDGTWSYEVVADAKFSTEPAPTDIVVRKVWADDDDAASDRPQSVTVQLVGDGSVVDEVTLSSANGWQHEFKGLDGSVTWQIVEKNVPEGYTVSVDREGATFTVTNTIQTPPNEEKPPAEKLPQTGLLWWPVLPLLLCGAGLMLFGWYRRRAHRGRS